MPTYLEEFRAREVIKASDGFITKATRSACERSDIPFELMVEFFEHEDTEHMYIGGDSLKRLATNVSDEVEITVVYWIVHESGCYLEHVR